MRLEQHSSRFVNLRPLFSVITLLSVIRWLGVLYLFGVLAGRSHKLKTLETDSKSIPRYTGIIFPLLEFEATLYQKRRAFTEIFSDQLRLSIPGFDFDKADTFTLFTRPSICPTLIHCHSKVGKHVPR